MSTRLNFSLPIKTRGGSLVEIYYIREGEYCNGAYYDKESDVWWPCQWSWNGDYADKRSALDLVNDAKTIKIRG
jgi:hypothetical protein